MAATPEPPILNLSDIASSSAAKPPFPPYPIATSSPAQREMEACQTDADLAKRWPSPPLAASIAKEQPPAAAVISLLSDSSESDVIITHATSRTTSSYTACPSSYPSSPSSSSFSSSASSSSSSSSGHTSLPSSKRQHRSGRFKTGPWSYRDRMRLVEALQRGVNLIALAQDMHRDIDDVFEKFSDVVAAGLYHSEMKDEETQTDAVEDIE